MGQSTEGLTGPKRRPVRQKRALAERLLSLNPKVRPDDVKAHYRKRGVKLNLQILDSEPDEGAPLVLIEGDRRALLFLADLLLAQATDPLDCGFQILLPANKLISEKSKYGLYVHALPCSHERPTS